LKIKYTVAGIATPESDYSALSGSLTIPVGVSEAVLSIRTFRDLITEGSETVSLTLTPDAAYTIGAAAQATVIILDSPMDTWRAEHFPAELADPEISGWAADPDQDGWDNLFEFFSGSDPRQPDATSAFGVRKASGDMFLDLIRNRDSALMFGLDSSLDLNTWTAVTNPHPDVVIQGPLEKMSWRRHPAPTEFFRLNLTPAKH
jgi:hypothetical protein